MLVTRLTAIANFIGMSPVNSGVVLSYGDNHISNNISTNGTYADGSLDAATCEHRGRGTAATSRILILQNWIVK